MARGIVDQTPELRNWVEQNEPTRREPQQQQVEERMTAAVRQVPRGDARFSPLVPASSLSLLEMESDDDDEDDAALLSASTSSLEEDDTSVNSDEGESVPTAASLEDKPVPKPALVERKRSVSFNQGVQVREYALTVGDHPLCVDGLPLSLDWHYEENSEKSDGYRDIDDYSRERMSSYRPPRRLSYQERRDKLFSFNNSNTQQEQQPCSLNYKNLLRDQEIGDVIKDLHRSWQNQSCILPPLAFEDIDLNDFDDEEEEEDVLVVAAAAAAAAMAQDEKILAAAETCCDFELLEDGLVMFDWIRMPLPVATLRSSSD